MEIPSTGASGTDATANNNDNNNSLSTEEQQAERRKKIKEIMADPNLTQQEKSRAVQSLMDGRRRSSCGGASITLSVHSQSSANSGSRSNSHSHNYVFQMAHAAAAAAEYYSSDEEGVGDGGAAGRFADVDMADANGFGSGPGGADFDDGVDYGYGARFEDERSVDSSVSEDNSDSPAVPAASMPSGSNYRQVHGRSYSLQDWNDADRVHAAAHSNIFLDNPAKISKLMEQSRPLCEHYDRMCTIVSPCCGLAFGCRICHDECPVLPKPLALRPAFMNDTGEVSMVAVHQAAQKDQIVLAERLEELKRQKNVERRRSMPLDFSSANDDEENHHAIDRFAIREVICRSCYTRQSSKTNNCISCGIQFGEYHCNICNLWMSDAESPYHCEACGFCRVGGRENFRHCDDCGMCIDAKLFDDHNCKAGKYMSNCPVCQEDLFSSRFATHELPCQHALHWHCYKELCSYSTQCPVCKKTAETPEYMASTWNAIATGIELQPVPPDMARCVNIFCNDCETSDTNRRWHFLGVRCLNCLSFNTNCEQIVMQGRDAAEFLDALDSSRPIPSSINVDNTNMVE